MPLVDAELDRQSPGRELQEAQTPEGPRQARVAVQAAWQTTVAGTPPDLVDAHVEDEWSLAQTLRHLILATDAWLRGGILRVQQPFHELGQVFTGAGLGRFTRAASRARGVPWEDPAFAHPGERTRRGVGVPARGLGPPRTGVAACLLLIAVIVVADLLAGREKTQYVGLLVAVPFLAATFTGVGGVVLLGLTAWLAGLAIGLLSEDGGSAPQRVRLVCLAAAVALAALAARSRRLREAQLIAVQSAADAASRAILHPLPAVVAGVPVAATYVSASEAARIGGDLYDAVATEHGLRMVIGDVRGKGLEAVRLAATALGAFREGAHREADLQRVAAAMHDAVRRDAGPEDFITAVLVQVRDEAVQMLGCGHPHPLRLRVGSVSELHLPEALPLGLGPPGPPVLVDVRPGDRVLLYTDGAIEARRAGRFFPLQDAVRDTLTTGSLDAAVEALGRQVQEYTERGAEDDVALLCFELPGVLSPASVPS